jgi:hypothetical protein
MNSQQSLTIKQQVLPILVIQHLGIRCKTQWILTYCGILAGNKDADQLKLKQVHKKSEKLLS